MRPNTVVASREGNLGGTEHKMMFDENSVAHLMSVLTDLYSDPELAVIREYSTNALDSHIAAGVSKPIEIVTPNPLSPFFKVKDYGLGMDEDDIQNIYSKYGASTKRNSDSVVGMLGLGCKSALTYTQQFTLNTVKNGVKYMVAVSRTEDGSGVMEIIDSSPTDEPNGVEVVVPVKRGNEFERKSQDFFRFWKAGTVLVNGAEPNHFEGTELSPGVFLVQSISSDYLVMGNVAYPLDAEHALSDAPGYWKRWGIVAHVEIGSVNFTPSRESLHYTRRTEETVRNLRKTVNERLPQIVQEDIDAQDNAFDGFLTYFKWGDTFGGGYYGSNNRMPRKIEYRGEELSQVIDFEGMKYDIHAARYAVSGIGRVSVKDIAKTPIIYGYSGDKVAPTHREKMRAWRGKNTDGVRNLLICDELPEIPDWIPVTTVSWEDVKKVKIVREKTGIPRSKPKFEIFFDGLTHLLTKDEITHTDIALVRKGNYMDVSDKRRLESVRPGIAVVTLPQGRWEAFQKSFPNARPLKEIMTELIAEIKDELSNEDLTYLSVNQYSRRTLTMFDESRIKDPALAKIVGFVKTRNASNEVKRYNTWHTVHNNVSDLHIADCYADGGKDALDDYPLLEYGSVVQNNLEDAYCYINAKYATLNK